MDLLSFWSVVLAFVVVVATCAAIAAWLNPMAGFLAGIFAILVGVAWAIR